MELGKRREITYPFTGRTLGDSLVLGVQYNTRHDADETAEQTEGREEPQPGAGCEENEVHAAGNC